jgi:hypothetical protein
MLADTMTTLAYGKTKLLAGQTARARKLRAKIQAAIPGQLEHFVSTGLEFGYAYTAGLVVPEGGLQPKLGAGVEDYLPTTWPGARLPHGLVRHGGEARPLIDLVHKRQFTLLVHDGDAWLQALRSAEWPHLHVSVIECEPAPWGVAPTLVDGLEVGQQGAVLVRPDGHVAWRTTQDAVAGVVELERAMAHLTGCFLANCAPEPMKAAAS